MSKTRGFKLSTMALAVAAVSIGFALGPVASDVSVISAIVPSAQAADSKGGQGADKGGAGVKGGQGQAGGSSQGGSSRGAESTLSTDGTEEAQGPKGTAGRPGDISSQKGTPNPNAKGDSDESVDRKGPRAGATPGTSGGRPGWAQEGIPEDVELGRLNVARSPSKVLDRSLVEALVNINANPALYTVATLDAVKAAILAGTYRVDSPLENLALLKDLLIDGKLDGITFTPGLTVTDLAAVLYAGAADKTVPVTAAQVDAVLMILEIKLPAGVTSADFAAKADFVRDAILTEHEAP